MTFEPLKNADIERELLAARRSKQVTEEPLPHNLLKVTHMTAPGKPDKIVTTVSHPNDFENTTVVHTVEPNGSITSAESDYQTYGGQYVHPTTTRALKEDQGYSVNSDAGLKFPGEGDNPKANVRKYRGPTAGNWVTINGHHILIREH